MELVTNVNQATLDVVLDGDITPIEVDGDSCYQRNEYITFTPEVEKDGLSFTDYTTTYTVISPTGVDTEITANGNNISFELDELGSYAVSITFVDNIDDLTYILTYNVECCDYLVIQQTECNTFVITNNGTEDVTIVITDLFNTDSIGDAIVPLESTILLAGDGVEVMFDDVSLYVADVSYTIGGEERTEQYIINNYCLIEECITSYTLDILCAENAQCTECPDGVDLNRMLALNYAYFLNVNSEYGTNNFYSGLEHATLVTQLSDMKGIMDKLYAYCVRRNCTGMSGIITNNTSIHSDCGCNG